MENVGIIAFAFGQQTTMSAGPSNEIISQIAIDIAAVEKQLGNTAYISAQWETALYCNGTSDAPDLCVSAYDDPTTHYINTRDVLDRSIAFFHQKNVRRVIVVAHPLHSIAMRTLISLRVWKIDEIDFDYHYNKRMSGIPYDTSPGNRQWWTRGPIRFIFYLARALVIKKHGN